MERGCSRFAAVEVVAEGWHDAVDNAEHAADDELHHAADADEGQVEGWRSIGEIISRGMRRQSWGQLRIPSPVSTESKHTLGVRKRPLTVICILRRRPSK